MVAILHMQPDFPVSKSPLGASNSTICPSYGKLQEARRGGCQNRSTRSTRCKRKIFFKSGPRPRGMPMPKQLFLACCDPVVARFGPPKIPKCIENGLFWDQKWVKNRFSQK